MLTWTLGAAGFTRILDIEQTVKSTVKQNTPQRCIDDRQTGDIGVDATIS